MSPPIGGSDRLGSWVAAETIWLSSPTTGPPLERAGRSRRQRLSPASESTIQPVVGSKPTSDTAPLP